jgi:integrase
MRGSIIKRYEKSYSIVINLGKDPATGKRKQQWYSVKGTKKQAEKRLAELLHELDTGMLVNPSKIIVAEFLKRWLNEYGRPNLTPRSFGRYSGIVHRHLIPDFGAIPLVSLKAEHLQAHYSKKLKSGLGVRSVRYHHVVIHKALATAIKWGLLQRNIADNVDIPRARLGEMQTWDEWDIARFMEAAKENPYFTLFYTSLFTALRRGELLALTWRDVDLILGQVSINRSLHVVNKRVVFTEPKSAKSRRTVALSPSAILVLREHREKQQLDRAMAGKTLTDDDCVFSHTDGAPLRPDTITHCWSKLLRNTGLKHIRLHDLRHTHASLLLKQGVHPKIVQERLGHASISITLDTYSHVAPGLQRAAANRFDDIVLLVENQSVG